MSAYPEVDLEHLLKLRVVVARIGEMDLAQWWNTRGQLGPLGAAALRRGLPRTHYFGQARSVFAVAAHRCDEVFNPPSSMTLWRLPGAIEEQFDARWEHWLDHGDEWRPFFEHVAQIDTTDLVDAARSFDLATQADVDRLAGLATSAEGRAVALPGGLDGEALDVTLMALAFAKGTKGSLAVPFARRGEA